RYRTSRNLNSQISNPESSWKSFNCDERRPERMIINHEETKNTKKDQKKTFALFVSSWLIL
ncbi:MAG TPA: hypothetical protein VG324_02185, partial [Blastocatellia bacterium]|nr:hypothetical protein [Blastocatellia bacterium]